MRSAISVPPEVWDGQGISAAAARYYGGFAQGEVKPTPDSPLLKLGIDKVPPIITSAVLLDARSFSAAARRCSRAS